MGNKKQRFTSGNKGLEKAVKSMAEHMRANSTSPSDRVRPDSQNNLASQPSSDDDDDFFGIPAGTTPTSLSDISNYFSHTKHLRSDELKCTDIITPPRFLILLRHQHTKQ